MLKGIEQLVAGLQPGRDVHGDDPSRAPLLRDFHGEIHRHAAVDQRAFAVAHRRERTGHGHARAHRVDQVAAVHRYGIAGFQVRADCAVGNRQVVEARDRRAGQQRGAQRDRQALALEQRRRHADLAVAQAETALGQEAAILGLAPRGEHAAVDAIDEHRVPVQRAHLRLDLGRAQAAGVQAADHRAHAGADDAVHRDALAFEHLDHADVRHAARTAAAEDQTGVEVRGSGGGGEQRGGEECGDEKERGRQAHGGRGGRDGVPRSLERVMHFFVCREGRPGA